MRSIILAAGMGTRLGNFTSDRPKCLVEVDGLSLLGCQIDILRSRGVDDIVVVGGYLSHMIKFPGVRVIHNSEYSEKNMVWSLYTALEYIRDDIIISYGDILYSVAILDILIASRANISVTVDVNWEAYWNKRSDNPLADAETLRINDEGDIVEIGNVPQTVEEIQAQYMGLMRFAAEGVTSLRDCLVRSASGATLGGKPIGMAYMTNLFQELIRGGLRVKALPITQDWLEIDTIDDLVGAHTVERFRSIRGELKG
jgi:choline kinase